MTRAKKHLIIDTILFFQMIALAITGIIIKWVLPPGSGGGRPWRDGPGQGWHGGGGGGWHGGGGGGWHGGGGGGGGDPLTFVGLSRHEWGDIHFWISMSLVVLLVLHVVLHWKWVVCQAKSLMPRRGSTAQRSGDGEERVSGEPVERQSFRPNAPGQPASSPGKSSGFLRRNRRSEPSM